MLRGCFASVVLWIAAGPLHSTPGDLDPTFGSNGVVISSFGSNDIATATSMALQPDGKIVVGGYIRGDLTQEAPAIVRYTTNGIVDTALGGKGWMSVRDWGGMSIEGLRRNGASFGGDLTSVAVKPDGKILFGFGATRDTSESFAIVCCNPNGSMDTGFNGWGYFVDSRAPYAFGGLALQPDNFTVFTRSSHLSFPTVPRGAVVSRLGTWGAQDLSFGINGFAQVLTNVTVGTTTFVAVARATLALPDGDVLVGGSAYDGTNRSAALAKTLSNGLMDTSFDGDGRVATPLGGYSVEGLAPQADGRIVAAGRIYDGTNSNTLLMRFLANGAPDTTFGSNGIVIAALGPLHDMTWAVALQADGKILVCGAFDNPAQRDSFLLRYNTDGTPDATFGSNGVVVTQFSPGNDYAMALAVQPDGKIVTVGYAMLSPSNHITLARYESGLGPSPEIDVRTPSNAPLTHTLSQLDVGSLLPGTSNTVTLTIRNTGYTNLTGLAVTIDGTNAADFTATQPPVTDLLPGSNTTLTITFTAAGLGQRTAALHIASSDLDENPFDITLVGRSLSHIEAWRLANFGSPDDTGPGADISNPESDSAPNLIEFATDSNPHLYGPIPATLAPDGISLRFTYARNKDAVGELTFIVEWSDTLLPDDWHSDGVVENVLPGGDGTTELVEAIIPSGPGPARFVRLRVTRP